MEKLPTKEQFDLVINLFKSQKFNEAKNHALNITKDFPGNKFGWKILSIILKKQGKLSEALEINLKTVNIFPNDSEVYYNLSLTYLEFGKLEEAKKNFLKAIKLNTKYYQAYNNLGTINQRLGDIKESEKNYRKAIDINPKYFEAYNNLGLILKQNGRYEEAEFSFKKILEIEPNFFYAHFNLATLYRDIGKIKESEQYYRKAIDLNPKYFEAYNNLGVLIRELGKLDEAIVNYNKAIELNQNFSEAYNNLGVAYKDKCELDKAENCFKKAIQINSNYADAYNNLSLTYLLNKDFNNYKKFSEWRWQANNDIGNKISTKKPIWNGEQNKIVYVWREQGIGEEVMYSSVLAELNSISKKIIINCDKRLIPLFKRSFQNNIIFESNREKISDNDFDYHIPMGSLWNYFRKNLENFKKTSAGFLKNDKDKTLSFRDKLEIKKNEKLIGLSWSTKSIRQMSKFRNIDLNLLTSVLKNKKFKLINLQYGEITTEIEKIKNSLGKDIFVFPFLDYKNNIDDLASLISACDEVISIQNFTAHLSGSLGIKTNLLLPYSRDARWGIDDRYSYIYNSVKLFRQTKINDWQNVINELIDDFKIK